MNIILDNDFSTRDDVLYVIEKTKQYIINSPNTNKTRKTFLIYYLHKWNKIFSSLKDDSEGSEKFVNQQFPLPLFFNYTDRILYARFDIDYINLHLENLETYQYKDIETKLNFSETPDDINSYNRSCLDSGSLITVSMFFGDHTYSIIDGNHRLYFVRKYTLKDFPVRNIGYAQLNKMQFISKFSYAIVYFINDLNFLVSAQNSKDFYKQFKKSLECLKNF